MKELTDLELMQLTGPRSMSDEELAVIDKRFFWGSVIELSPPPPTWWARFKRWLSW